MHKEFVNGASTEKIAVLMQGISGVKPNISQEDALSIANKIAIILTNYDGRKADYALGQVLDSLRFQQPRAHKALKPLTSEDIDKLASKVLEHTVQSNGNVVIPADLVRVLFDYYRLDYANKLYVHYDPYDAFSFYITSKWDISTFSSYISNRCSLSNIFSIGFTNQAYDECMRRMRIKKDAVKLFCGNMPRKAEFKLDLLPGNQLLAIKVTFKF